MTGKSFGTDRRNQVYIVAHLNKKVNLLQAFFRIMSVQDQPACLPCQYLKGEISVTAEDMHE